MRERFIRALSQGVDPLGLAIFRVLLGLLFVFSSVRFVWKGWVHSTYIEPSFHFRYAGFEWVPSPEPWLLYTLFGGMALGGLGIALGAFYRWSASLWLGCFLWVEVLDKSTYLNHYYLMTLLGTLALILPLHRTLSVDVHRKSVDRWDVVPQWVLFLLRFQVGVVYFFAGFAKLNSDWLLRGEPMWTWLRSMEGMSIFGPLLALQTTAIFMSWAGALYDLSIPLWLSIRRTRGLAFCTVVIFHTITWLLFPIGVFPWLMIISATLFFDPDWARLAFRVQPKSHPPPKEVPKGNRLGRATLAFLGLWCLLQVLIPLRSLAYPGDVNWHEKGFRFSWRVMLIEKTGFVEYRVVDPSTHREWLVSPRHELSPMQYKMMSTQPDMIKDYGRHIAKGYAEQGLRVEVYADSWVSWNGRRAQPAIDRKLDVGGMHPITSNEGAHPGNSLSDTGRSTQF